MVLGFQEIPEDEFRPPEHIYGDDEKLIEWFDWVKQARAEKYSSGSGEAALEEVPMMSNELAGELGV